MKLSTIIRSVVAPIVQFQTWNDAIVVRLFRESGPGFLMSDDKPIYGFPPRAQEARLGDLHIRYWGRDTFVHQSPEAS